MEPRKISFISLAKIINDLRQNKSKPIGMWLFNGYKIQISRYNLDTKDRVAILYKRRRAQGLCTACGKKVRSTNPRTGRLYRLCDEHRRKIDRKDSAALS